MIKFKEEYLFEMELQLMKKKKRLEDFQLIECLSA